jgi:hypothetical protein
VVPELGQGKGLGALSAPGVEDLELLGIRKRKVGHELAAHQFLTHYVADLAKSLHPVRYPRSEPITVFHGPSSYAVFEGGSGYGTLHPPARVKTR